MSRLISNCFLGEVMELGNAPLLRPRTNVEFRCKRPPRYWRRDIF